MTPTPSLTAALSTLYKHEINVQIASFWDAGYTVRLGDEDNGFRAEQRFTVGRASYDHATDNDMWDAVATWLRAQAPVSYPGCITPEDFDAND